MKSFRKALFFKCKIRISPFKVCNLFFWYVTLRMIRELKLWHLYITKSKRAIVTRFSFNDPGQPREKGHRVQQKAHTKFPPLPLLPAAAAAATWGLIQRERIFRAHVLFHTYIQFSSRRTRDRTENEFMEIFFGNPGPFFPRVQKTLISPPKLPHSEWVWRAEQTPQMGRMGGDLFCSQRKMSFLLLLRLSSAGASSSFHCCQEEMAVKYKALLLLLLPSPLFLSLLMAMMMVLDFGGHKVQTPEEWSVWSPRRLRFEIGFFFGFPFLWMHDFLSRQYMFLPFAWNHIRCTNFEE